MNIEEFKPALREAFDRNIAQVRRAMNQYREAFDEKQIFEAFCQALASGDFLKYVRTDGVQNVTYIPFREVEELRAKYNDLIMAVASKFPDETRHETAKRYIVEAENLENSGTAIQDGIGTGVAPSKSELL